MNIKILDTEPRAILVEKFFSDRDLAGLLEASKREFKREETNRIIYDGTVCEIKPRALRRLADTDVFRQRIENFIKKNTEYNVKFRKLWFVNTTHKNADNTKLPYIAHFDKKRFLKFMIYLTDVTEDCGPLTLFGAHGLDVESRRQELQIDQQKSNIVSLHSANATALTASAGSLLMFDTNTPHLAGMIKPGSQRKIARFDFEADGWNPKSGKEWLKDLIGL